MSGDKARHRLLAGSFASLSGSMVSASINTEGGLGKCWEGLPGPLLWSAMLE